MSEQNAEFKSLVENLLGVRDDIDTLEAALKKKNEELAKIQSKVLSVMDSLEMGSFDFQNRKLTKVNKSTFKQPADKAAFFEYLKQEKAFEALVSVNSQTLNAWLRGKQKDAEEAGEFFDLPPGIEEPTKYAILQVRKK